jgi:hypothetical protein
MCHVAVPSESRWTRAPPESDKHKAEAGLIERDVRVPAAHVVTSKPLSVSTLSLHTSLKGESITTGWYSLRLHFASISNRRRTENQTQINSVFGNTVMSDTRQNRPRSSRRRSSPFRSSVPLRRPRSLPILQPHLPDLLQNHTATLSYSRYKVLRVRPHRIARLQCPAK